MYPKTNRALHALLEEQAESLKTTFGQAFAGLDPKGPRITAEHRRPQQHSPTSGHYQDHENDHFAPQKQNHTQQQRAAPINGSTNNNNRNRTPPPQQQQQPMKKNSVYGEHSSKEASGLNDSHSSTQSHKSLRVATLNKDTPDKPDPTPSPTLSSHGSNFLRLLSRGESHKRLFRAISDFGGFCSVLESEFPDSVEMQVFLGQAQTVLRQRGFDQHTALPLVSVCRDEITRPFVETVDEIFGSSFSIASLAGFVFCGKTGFSAGFHHAPENADGVQRYVFFIGPHIAINEDGEVGVVWRKRQHHCSTACGALVGILGELQSGNLKVALDPTDLEQSLVRQQLVGALRYGQIPTLVEMTKVAREVIQRQVLNTLDSMSLDKCSYAVISFVQIHGPHDSQYIWPCDMFLSESGKPGERVDIRAEVLACKSCTALQHHQRMLAAKTMCVIADGDLEEVEDLIARAGDTDVQDVDGRTALHIACTEGKTDVVEYLLEQNANVAVHDRWGTAPIDNAVLNDHLHIADRLLFHGAFMTDKVVAQQLILAASTGNEGLVKTVLKYARPGAANCTDYAGRRAMSIAISTNHASIARILADTTSNT